MKAALILATQLFERHPAQDDPDIDAFLIVESAPRFRQVPYHSHKIVLLLSGLRHAASRIADAGRPVFTVPLRDDLSFAAGLARLVREHDIDGLAWMSATDRGVDARISRLCRDLGLQTRRYPDALFLTPADTVDTWFAEHGTVPMEEFYRWQRRRTGILMDEGKPVGNRWNFDADNREPLPREGIRIPSLPAEQPDAITRATITEVAELFPDHPGDPADFWLPVTPDGARARLAGFVAERLPTFGRYEDAMAADEPFLFHSVLSPLLNTGLLTADEVLEQALAARDRVPLASLEGYVRQVLGWREYMRGAYRHFGYLRSANHFGLTRPLEPWWYTGEGIPDELPVPVRTVLRRVHRFGYAHHIERLMVLGNWFLLEGYDPHEVYTWFLALFVDAYDWVMLPNVVGMSQYADGGSVATKPYISGGAYLQRMGSWWPSSRAAKESAYTDGYWRFLERHEDVLAGNHRLAVPLAQMRSRRGQREADAASPRSSRSEDRLGLRESALVSLLVNVVNVFVDQSGGHGNPLGIIWSSASTRKREQQIAADLGFSETIFIDDLAGDTVTARIFTPTEQLRFAGHPTVGLAAWLNSTGEDIRTIKVPAGNVRVRIDGDLVFVTALPEWAPVFELNQLDTPAEVDAVDPDAYGMGRHYVWAWLDEPAARVRARMFARDLGIREDEATGAAAVRLTAALGRDLEIRQGEGSQLRTHVRYLGQQVEVGGRVSDSRLIELG